MEPVRLSCGACGVPCGACGVSCAACGAVLCSLWGCLVEPVGVSCGACGVVLWSLLGCLGAWGAMSFVCYVIFTETCCEGYLGFLSYVFGSKQCLKNPKSVLCYKLIQQYLLRKITIITGKRIALYSSS